MRRPLLTLLLACAVSAAAVNVTVLLSGGGLVRLVSLMTATRLAGYVVYRLNAYHVFPLLKIRVSLFRKERLRELTSFGAWMMVQTGSCKLNYASDAIVIGAFLTTGAIAVTATARAGSSRAVGRLLWWLR